MPGKNVKKTLQKMQNTLDIICKAYYTKNVKRTLQNKIYISKKKEIITMDTSLIAVYCLALVNACLYLQKKRAAEAAAKVEAAKNTVTEKGDCIED